jgi:hypothetical protein
MLKTVSSITNALGALNYKGTWNASTNSPALSSGAGTTGDYYVVSVAGTTSLDGISNWGVGDWATFNGSVWQRVEGGADLNGVNVSFTGTALGPTYETSNAANGLTIADNSITADGTNADIDINLAPKGAGTMLTSKSYDKSQVNVGSSASPASDVALQYRNYFGSKASSVRFWNITANSAGRTWTTIDCTDDSGAVIPGVTATPYNGVTTYGSVQPHNDGASSCGLASQRWSVVYAANGTINTSDGNQKQQVADLTVQEKAVAASIKSLIKTFKFNGAVALKGDGARIHVGVIAQDVQAAFSAQGLDAHRYGLFCSDTWYEVDGKAQNGAGDYYTEDTPEAIKVTRLGVRYEQLLAFVIAAL